MVVFANVTYGTVLSKIIVFTAFISVFALFASLQRTYNPLLCAARTSRERYEFASESV